ncbi:ABC transporter ATP-binding protein [Hippea alviniae]|uniref:ABC transporter ATP-binding protein n=1 Tax=Hippea alviniae TaxID=1279027 RepID=UPI0003B6EC20|nr:ABC transporter ATP-binding protein [Hippea alviniae]
MEKTPILNIKSISKSFGGIKAVENVSFTVKEKQIKALIGPNGAGKTTLFNIITGLYKADNGSVEFLGSDILSKKPYELVKLGIARTFQNIQLSEELTVLENVAIGMDFKKRTGLFEMMFKPSKPTEKQKLKEAFKVLSFLKIEEFAYKYSNEIPFGVKRLVELARAMVSSPKLLLLDEPAAGLNEKETDNLLKAIFRIWEKGVSILLIEHDIEFVSNCSHSIVVMDSGKKIAEGLPSEVLNDERVMRAYLGD